MASQNGEDDLPGRGYNTNEVFISYLIRKEIEKITSGELIIFVNFLINCSEIFTALIGGLYLD